MNLPHGKPHVGECALGHIGQQGFSRAGASRDDDHRSLQRDLPDDFAESSLQRATDAFSFGARHKRIRIQPKFVGDKDWLAQPQPPPFLFFFVN